MVWKKDQKNIVMGSKMDPTMRKVTAWNMDRAMKMNPMMVKVIIWKID